MEIPCSSSKSEKLVFLNLFKIFITLFFISLLLFSIIFIFLPLLFLRLLIYSSRFIFLSSFDHFLSPQSSIIYSTSQSNPINSNLILKITLDGQLSNAELKNRLALLLQQNSAGELKQCVGRRWGFYYWKWIPHFDPHQQIKEFNEVEIKGEELERIQRELLRTPFQREKLLWEIYVYNNVINAKKKTKKDTILLIKVNQALADGQTLLELFQELKFKSDGQQAIVAMIQSNKNDRSGIMEKIKFAIKVGIIGPYQLINNVVNEKLDEYYSKIFLRIELNTTSKDNNDDIPETELIHLKDIKRIAMSHMSPAAALIISIIVGAMRRKLLKIKARFPDKLRMNYLMPIPLKRERLGNFVAYIPVETPLDMEDPSGRLSCILKQLENLLNSTTPYVMFGFVCLVGTLPQFLIPFFSRRLPLGTVLLSSYVGPNNLQIFMGLKVSDICVMSGCPNQLGGASVAIHSVSYGGEVHLAVTTTTTGGLKEQILKELDIFGENAAGGFGGFFNK